MTVRIDTTLATAESASFSPTGDFFVQVTADAGSPMIAFDVSARMDNTAEWVVIDTILAREKVVRYAAMPFVKVAVRNNIAGKSAKVFTNL